MCHLAWPLAVVGSSLLGAPSSGRAEPQHTLYLLVQQTKDYVIGGRRISDSGLFRTRDRKAIQFVSHQQPRPFQIGFDPRDPNRMYYANLNGISRTLDGGKSWKRVTGWNITEPKDLQVDPHNPDRIWIALPDGIALSPDGGDTWQYQDAGIKTRFTEALVVERAFPDTLLAGTERGIYRTSNAGNTWSLVQPTTATVHDLLQSPHDSMRYFAVTQSDGAWASQDGGISWSRIADVPDQFTLHHLAADFHDPNRLALCGWGAGVLVSEDGGKTWQDRTAGLPSREIWSVGSDPDFPGRLYASPFEEALYVSDDFGKSWQPLLFEGALVWEYQFHKEGPR